MSLKGPIAETSYWDRHFWDGAARPAFAVPYASYGLHDLILEGDIDG
jgi:hypothetical protein